MTIVRLNWTAFTKTARTVTTEMISYLTGVYIKQQKTRTTDLGCILANMQATVSDQGEEDIHIYEYMVSGEPMHEVVREHTVHTV